MKKILGLDLGTTSIGWAFVEEAESDKERSNIIKLGVRVNPLSTDEQQDFEKGRPLSINADRTLKRSTRRNLQRFKLRRENLIQILKKHKIISDSTVLTEIGKDSTHETLRLRAQAVKTKVEKDEFARILLAINKKRGYKSSRKVNNEEEGKLIDGMRVAMKLYERNITPGQFCYELLKGGGKLLPDFYRSDLQNEFNEIWKFQKQFYPDILDEELHQKLINQGQQNTRKRFLAIKGIYTADNKGKRSEKKLQSYKWRSEAVSMKLPIEEVAYVITEVNNNLNNSSGYLGAISDRSKELYFNRETIGENLFRQLEENKHTSLKNQVFYRQDYLDEFEKIWETQKEYHSELTNELKKEIRDIIIFYQRRLKSQKGLISFCEFESFEKQIDVDGKAKSKTIGNRVSPKSSPLFQEFKIWQNLSNIIVKNKTTKEEYILSQDDKELLFSELNIKGNLSKVEFLKLLFDKPENWDLNFTIIQGNNTNHSLYEAYAKILSLEGYEFDLKNDSASYIREMVHNVFQDLGIDTSILRFNSEIEGRYFQKQKSYLLWHLLYSYEGDNSNTGNDALFTKLNTEYGFKKEYAQFLINVSFTDDYGNLSTKAMRKIIPFLKENTYSEACVLAGYNHSHSITKEENEKRVLKEKLVNLPKNSLRNPVVEKILNQMINVINAIIEDPKLGKPDEIRIELARELKKNAKERSEMTSQINAAKVKHDQIRITLKNDFGIRNPSRNDIIKYKLYQELICNGHKTFYSDKYISPAQLFSKEIDIEHIIPKALLFDDSFSNKTLEFRSENLDKSDETAYDFIKRKYGDNYLNIYMNKIEKYYKEGHIGKAKYKKLLKSFSEIGEGFIERDLRESQYIAKKAKEILFEISKSVVSTSGKITSRLREDWGLINVMKELNLEKYRNLGLTFMEERKDGQKIEKIIDWTKRNDHRHHAMDALTVAFTKHNHIQYLNNLNARKNENHKKHSNIIAIEKKETFIDNNGKRLFKSPITNFRQTAKLHLSSILISHKAKNKVVTRNKNKVSGSNKIQIALTPRGQLHKETVYGKSVYYQTKDVKIGSAFTKEIIAQVANQSYKKALIKRLEENNYNPKIAFVGKNSPLKNPIVTDSGKKLPEKVKIVWLENQFTIRKDITPDLKIEKVIDNGIKRVLESRLKQYSNDAKEAFSNLEKEPIWLNKEKGIQVKRVTISGVNNAEPLHIKKDHLGNDILDVKGIPVPADFVSTGNNHHVAIYIDGNGNFQEEVVSFYDAVARVNAEMPVVWKQHPEHPNWQFQFTMKQNEMFIFPNEKTGFDPKEIDLLDEANYHIISPNLFRVQKIATKNYFFRHHLETNVETKKELKNICYINYRNTNAVDGIIKVRLNNLGKIVSIGEY